MAYDYDRRVAGVKMLDLSMMEKLRKDFLTLMKNVPLVKDYETALRLDDAFREYAKNFNEFFFEDFLNRSLKHDESLLISDGDRKYIDKKLRSVAWSFYIELRLPVSRMLDAYHTEESNFHRFNHDRDKWAAALKRRAVAFWKPMKETIDWYKEKPYKDAPTEGIPVKVRDVDRVQMEGVPVLVYGYDISDEYDRDYMERFKEGMKLYKKRAQQILPWLFKNQLPVELRFDSLNIDKGGEYKGQTISFNATSFSDDKNPNVVAHVMAHEMGHHLYKLLDAQARTYWETAVRDDYGEMDLRELLKKWPESIKYPDIFADSISESDPILSLQVAAASFGFGAGGRHHINTRDDVVRWVEEGETMMVPQNPVTGYAGKNAEETFCDAIGRLVGYGPATVLPVVKGWLATVIPGSIRLASREVAQPFDYDRR